MTGGGEGDRPACTTQGRKAGDTPRPVFRARGARPLSQRSRRPSGGPASVLDDASALDGQRKTFWSGSAAPMDARRRTLATSDKGG